MNTEIKIKIKFCDLYSYNMTKNGIKKSVYNEFKELVLYNIPGNYSFYLVLDIDHFPKNQVNKYTLEFSDPDNQKVFILNNIEAPTIISKNDKGVMSISIDCRNVIFKKSGIYSMKAYLNNKFISSKEIMVRQEGE